MELKTSTCCALTSVDHVSWQRGVFELISHLGTAHGFIDGKYSKCLFMILLCLQNRACSAMWRVQVVGGGK